MIVASMMRSSWGPMDIKISLDKPKPNTVQHRLCIGHPCRSRYCSRIYLLKDARLHHERQRHSTLEYLQEQLRPSTRKHMIIPNPRVSSRVIQAGMFVRRPLAWMLRYMTRTRYRPRHITASQVASRSQEHSDESCYSSFWSSLCSITESSLLPHNCNQQAHIVSATNDFLVQSWPEAHSLLIVRERRYCHPWVSM